MNPLGVELLNRQHDQAAFASPRCDKREAIVYCASVKNGISRELFEAILENEEEHIDWLEIQMEMIEKLVLQNYL